MFKLKKSILNLVLVISITILPFQFVLAVDSDNDGLEDNYETLVYGTDPSNPDTDGDGYTDGMELQGGYNPNGDGKIAEDQLAKYVAAIEAMGDVQEMDSANGENTESFDTENGVDGNSGVESTSDTKDEGITAGSGADMSSGNGLNMTSENGVTEPSGVDGTSVDNKTDNTPTYLENVIMPEPTPVAENNPTINNFGAFANCTSNNGCVDAKITDIDSDGLNNLWITTGSGLLKFDNKEYVLYTTENGMKEQIKNTTVDKDNILWISSTDGVTRFDPSRELNSAYTYYNKDNGLDTSLAEVVYASNDRMVWLGTSGEGLYKFNGADWTHFEDENTPLISNINVTSIGETSNGEIWVSTKNNGIFKIAKNEIKQYQTSSGLVSNRINDLYIGKSDEVYAATDFGLAKYENNTWSNIRTRGNINGTIVRSIITDKAGNIVLGTDKGISIYDQTNETWTNITKENGLIDNNVFRVFEDPANTIWVGTNQGITTYIPDIKEEVPTEEENDEINLDDAVDTNEIESEVEIIENINIEPETIVSESIIDKAKNGDVNSIILLGGPLLVLLLIIVLLILKKAKRKSDSDDDNASSIGFNNPSPEKKPSDTPHIPPVNTPSTIAQIGKPMGNIQNMTENKVPTNLNPEPPKPPVAPPPPPSTPSAPIPSAPTPSMMEPPKPSTPNIPEPPKPPVTPPPPSIPNIPVPPSPSPSAPEPPKPLIPNIPEPPKPPVAPPPPSNIG